MCLGFVLTVVLCLLRFKCLVLLIRFVFSLNVVAVSDKS